MSQLRTQQTNSNLGLTSLKQWEAPTIVSLASVDTESGKFISGAFEDEKSAGPPS